VVGSPTDVSVGADLARRQAREILTERRFHAASVPRPLHGLLHAIGRALEGPVNALDDLVGHLAQGIPGGRAVVWAALAVLVLAICATLATRGARRALRSPADRRHGLGDDAPVRAGDLERAALDAEREGRHGDAVRLRFRAGLMRLSETELLAVAPSMSNAEISRALRSARFDDLARRFDEIVYGRRPALEEDVRATRLEWTRLLSARPAKAG
jgi:hypothetical protein